MSNSEYKTPFGSTSDTNAGWTFGAGAEMMVMPNITIRAEYLRYELGNAGLSLGHRARQGRQHRQRHPRGVNYKF